jgi:hypothetical protein
MNRRGGSNDTRKRVGKRNGWALATAVVAGTAAPVAVDAGQSATIRLLGHVPATASIKLASAEALISDDLRKPVNGRLVTRITEQSNAHGGYVIEVMSENAARVGGPALLNADSGAAVSYRLNYGGKDIAFNGSSAVLAESRAKSMRSEAKDLEISTLPTANGVLPVGAYVDKLTVVIKSR